MTNEEREKIITDLCEGVLNVDLEFVDGGDYFTDRNRCPLCWADSDVIDKLDIKNFPHELKCPYNLAEIILLFNKLDDEQ